MFSENVADRECVEYERRLRTVSNVRTIKMKGTRSKTGFFCSVEPLESIKIERVSFSWHAGSLRPHVARAAYPLLLGKYVCTVIRPNGATSIDIIVPVDTRRNILCSLGRSVVIGCFLITTHWSGVRSSNDGHSLPCSGHTGRQDIVHYRRALVSLFSFSLANYTSPSLLLSLPPPFLSASSARSTTGSHVVPRFLSSSPTQPFSLFQFSRLVNQDENVPAHFLTRCRQQRESRFSFVVFPLSLFFRATPRSSNRSVDRLFSRLSSST